MYKNYEFCLYDTETTGLDVLEESILEMSFIDLKTNDILYHEYIYPSNNKEITNSHIHHVDKKLLDEKNALNIKQALTKLNDRLSNYYKDKKIILVAHNNFSYDQLILESEYKRNSIKILNNILFYDSLPFFRKVFTDCSSFKLGNLYKKLISDKEEGEFHTALYDTQCLAKLFKLAIEKCNSKTLFNNLYIKFPITSPKFIDLPLKYMDGYYYSMKLEQKGIKKIKNLVNIYLITKKNDEYFQKFMKDNFGIYSKNVIRKFLYQIKLII